MFLVIDNYDSFTFNLVQAFHSLGLLPQVLRNDDPRLLSFAERHELTGVCLGPGPGRPEEAGACLEFLKRLPAHVPVLGVCLGHQILGFCRGGRIVASTRILHGKACNVRHDGQGVFAGLPTPMRAGRYHSLRVQADDRADFIISAQDKDGEIMGLRYADRPWEGVQFHPESVLTPDGIRLLANFAAQVTQKKLSQVCPGVEPESIIQKTLTPPRLSEIMDALGDKRDLTEEQAKSAFATLMEGAMSPAQAGAFLLGLRAKGESAEEMVQAAYAILERAVPVAVAPHAPVLDVVGTGGDGRSSFNCSTGTALVLAALGHKVLKHGNRSVSSRCGSADVLEGLGIALDFPVEDIPQRLENDGFVFLFAPRFHPSFRHIMPIRRELGVRTLFNLMGPLVNPGRPGLCFFGVASPDILPLFARTLARMGCRTGAVVCGAGGYDELTTLGPADVAYVRGQDVRFDTLHPADFGFVPCTPEELAIKGAEEGVAVLRDLLDGKGPKAMSDMLALNVGFGLHLLRPEQPLQACMAEARLAVQCGMAGQYLRKLTKAECERRLNVA